METQVTDTAPISDFRTVESGLKALWERVRKAAEVISTLRSDNKALSEKVDQLEAEMRKLQVDVAQKDHLIRKASTEKQSADAHAGAVLANGEREALSQKVKELLAKLDGYL